MSKKKDLNTMTEAVEMDRDQRIAELEAQIRDAEEKALDRVCKALNVEPSTVKDAEKNRPIAPPKTPQIRMFVQTPVTVNGRRFVGDVTVPIDTARVIQQAIGDRRMRYLRELTSSNFILQELQGGGFAPKLINQTDIHGDPVTGRKDGILSV